MALAFHSDAGVRRNDETIGTLGIYFTQENGGRFEGVSCFALKANGFFLFTINIPFSLQN